MQTKTLFGLVFKARILAKLVLLDVRFFFNFFLSLDFNEMEWHDEYPSLH